MTLSHFLPCPECALLAQTKSALPRSTFLAGSHSDMSAVSCSRLVCWATWQTCLLCDTAEMSAV